jgi:hypothetical protein
MKILFYSYKSTYSGKSYGGAEKSMSMLAESLANLGCDVHYLSGVDHVRFSLPKEVDMNTLGANLQIAIYELSLYKEA